MIIKILWPCVITGSFTTSFLVLCLHNYPFSLRDPWTSSRKYGFCVFTKACWAEEGVDGPWLHSAGRRQSCFLSFSSLPAVPRTVLSFLFFFFVGESPSPVHTPQSKGPLCPTAKQTAGEHVTSRFCPGTVLATLVSNLCGKCLVFPESSEKKGSSSCPCL